jgi:hypothetical protein
MHLSAIQSYLPRNDIRTKEMPPATCGVSGAVREISAGETGEQEYVDSL